MSSLLAIIPALDEEQTIADVIADVKSHLQAAVLVIDDGSTDRTGEVAIEEGATVLPLPFNSGVGTAIRTGIRFAFENGYTKVIQLDADGQHGAAQAKLLLDLMQIQSLDVVVGSRFAAGYHTGRARRFMMRILARMVSRRIGIKITDTTSGFRAMGPRAIALFATRYPDEYLSDTVEALLVAGRAGLRIGEVDIQMEQRKGGLPSTSALLSTYHLIRLMLVLLLDRGRPHR